MSTDYQEQGYTLLESFFDKKELQQIKNKFIYLFESLTSSKYESDQLNIK